MIHL
jgi:hypothetical protein